PAAGGDVHQVDAGLHHSSRFVLAVPDHAAVRAHVEASDAAPEDVHDGSAIDRRVALETELDPGPVERDRVRIDGDVELGELRRWWRPVAGVVAVHAGRSGDPDDTARGIDANRVDLIAGDRRIAHVEIFLAATGSEHANAVLGADPGRAVRPDRQRIGGEERGRLGDFVG